jgi:protein-disulfide isomerase
MKESPLSVAFTAVLTICAVLVTAMLVRREFFPPTRTTAVEKHINNWESFRGGQSLTPPGRPVSLIVFSDYQCPACRILARQLDTLRERFPTQLSVYYRNIPIASHRFARPAAFAAECAGRDGRFDAAHHLRFAEAESIGVRSWGRFARDIGVPDTASFSKCVRDSLPAQVVHRDELDGKALDIKATPTMLLDDRLLQGAPTLEKMQDLIASRVKLKTASR